MSHHRRRIRYHQRESGNHRQLIHHQGVLHHGEWMCDHCEEGLWDGLRDRGYHRWVGEEVLTLQNWAREEHACYHGSQNGHRNQMVREQGRSSQNGHRNQMVREQGRSEQTCQRNSTCWNNWRS